MRAPVVLTFILLNCCIGKLLQSRAIGSPPKQLRKTLWLTCKSSINEKTKNRRQNKESGGNVPSFALRSRQLCGKARRHCCRWSRKQILTKSQNVWHPVRGTEEQQEQQRDQPEVRPGNETGYRQMVGGNLHVVVFFVNGHWSNPPRARVLLPRKSSGRLPRQGDGGPGCARSRHGHLRFS